MGRFCVHLRARGAKKYLSAWHFGRIVEIMSELELDSDSGTGPDKIATLVLIICCRPLAKPFAMLAERIVRTGPMGFAKE